MMRSSCVRCLGEGSSTLRAARLSPAVVDIEEDVRLAVRAQEAVDAGERGAALSDLLLSVKARIRAHCRRQLQLEGERGAAAAPAAPHRPHALPTSCCTHAAQSPSAYQASRATAIRQVRRTQQPLPRPPIALDAHELYPLRAIDPAGELLRCALPNRVEVELRLPASWPEEEAGPQPQLVALQGLRASQVRPQCCVD